jgi:hypothetical protein
MTEPTWLHENFDISGSSIGFRVTRKLDEVQSPFQKIEIYETTDWGNLMVIDGAMMLTTRDNFLYHEMMSHPALFTHADPKRVVIIGGGDCGTLREVLQAPGRREGGAVRHRRAGHAHGGEVFPGAVRVQRRSARRTAVRRRHRLHGELRARQRRRRDRRFHRSGRPGRRPVQRGLLPVLPPRAEAPTASWCSRANRRWCWDLIKEMRHQMGKAGFASFQHPAVPAALLSPDRLVELHEALAG